MGFCAKLFSVVVVLVAVVLGLANTSDKFSGTIPAFHLLEEYGYLESDIPDLTGQVFLVTGANSGLGLGTAQVLARANATVAMTCRSVAKCATARAEVEKTATKDSKVLTYTMDLASLASVRAFVAEFTAVHTRLDSLILNAGIMAAPFSLTEDGIESQFAVNHVGHFALTKGLLPLLESSAPSRVTVVSSLAHHFPHSEGVFTTLEQINDEASYDPAMWYGQSKLSNILFANELSARVAEKGIYVNSVHPGGVRGGLLKFVAGPIGSLLGPQALETFQDLAQLPYWDRETGALTTLLPASSPKVVEEGIHATYFVPIARAKPTSTFAQDAELGRKLWDFTEKLIA